GPTVPVRNHTALGCLPRTRNENRRIQRVGSPGVTCSVAGVTHGQEDIRRQLPLYRKVPVLNICRRLIWRQAQEYTTGGKTDVLVLRGIIVRKRADTRRETSAALKVGPWIGERRRRASQN